jgi:hypothetical protein
MTARVGWLERLLDWSVGVSHDGRHEPRWSDRAELLVPAHEQATDDATRYARNRNEREIELRILMSTWM